MGTSAYVYVIHIILQEIIGACLTLVGLRTKTSQRQASQDSALNCF